VTSSPTLSVVVPVYGNESTVVELRERLRTVLEARGELYEIVFVDDASPDRARLVLTALANEDSRIRLICHDVNKGQQAAILAGLRLATGERVVVMDADLQDPPEAMPALLDLLDRGPYEAVFAGRVGRYESTGRLATSRVFKWLVHRLTGAPRDAGTYVAMRRRMREPVLGLSGARPFLVATIGRTGLPVASVPVLRHRRPNGVSAYSSLARARVAAQALRQILVWKSR